MRALLVGLLFLAMCPATHAQNRAWNYVKSHKVLLVSDAVVLLAHGADAAATVHCQHSTPQCREDGFPIKQLFGPRPSNAAVYGTILLGGALIDVTAHVFYHYQNARPNAEGTQYAFVLWEVPACFLSGAGAQNNASIAGPSPMAQARARLMQK